MYADRFEYINIQAQNYLDEVKKLYPKSEGSAVDDHFHRILEGISGYVSASEKANVLTDLISEVEHPELNPNESVRKMYEDYPKDEKERLIKLLKQEQKRQEVLAKEAEDKKNRVERMDEAERKKMLDVLNLLIDEPEWGARHPSVELLGKKYYYNLFGFKPGDVIKNPDEEHEGEWIIDGSFTAIGDNAGVTLVRPEIAKAHKRIAQIKDDKEKYAEIEKLGEYETLYFTQLELRALRERMEMN